MQTIPAPEVPKQLSAPRCRVLHVWLSEEEFAVISKEADRRRQHVDAFAAELLLTGVVALCQARSERGL